MGKKSNYYSDTDSFVYEIHTECFYTDIRDNLDRFDTSDYPPDNAFQIPRINKKIPGFFKDELNGQIITEFVGLRSKMYSLKAGKIIRESNVDGAAGFSKVRGVEKMKKAKGVKKYILKNQISFENYLECIRNNTVVTRNQNSIRSKMHQGYSITQKKIVLSAFDNKRIILTGNIETRPYGHYQNIC